MANELISIERLSDYNDNLLRDANILKRKTAYVLDSIVNKGQIYLKCIQAGTTDTVALPLTNVQIGDELTDGSVKWEVISLNGAGAGNGNGLQDWKPQTEYYIDDNFVYENEIYKVRVKFTSGTNFENTQLMEEYTPVAWEANHEYNVGDIFVENNVFYKVINAYTSGATFSVTSDIEVYTPIMFANKEQISIDDIVEYNTNYYKALQNFVCGNIFSLYVFEKYVPHELTDIEVNNAIKNFKPSFRGTVGGSAGVNYSTEEQEIGTWIDGKPLYQITIQDTMPVVSSEGTRTKKVISVNSLNIDNCIEIIGVVYTILDATTTVYDNFNAINNLSTSSYIYAACEKESGAVIVDVTSTRVSDSNQTCYITLKYTKTTD